MSLTFITSLEKLPITCFSYYRLYLYNKTKTSKTKKTTKNKKYKYYKKINQASIKRVIETVHTYIIFYRTTKRLYKDSHLGNIYITINIKPNNNNCDPLASTNRVFMSPQRTFPLRSRKETHSLPQIQSFPNRPRNRREYLHSSHIPKQEKHHTIPRSLTTNLRHSIPIVPCSQCCLRQKQNTITLPRKVNNISKSTVLDHRHHTKTTKYALVYSLSPTELTPLTHPFATLLQYINNPLTTPPNQPYFIELMSRELFQEKHDISHNLEVSHTEMEQHLRMESLASHHKPRSNPPFHQLLSLPPLSHHRVLNMQYYNLTMIGTQYGGGTPTCSQALSIPLHTIKTSLHRQLKWLPLSGSNTTLICQNHLTNQQTWTTEYMIPYRHTPHPLLDHIDCKALLLIKQTCQNACDGPLFKGTTMQNLIIDSQHIRELISHGTPINDQIITLYLEMIGTKYNVTRLSTAFFPRLIEQGWQNVQQFFAQTHPRFRPRTPNRPTISGEQCILIPIFVNGCHWIALARRELNNRVHFFYNDDMNNPNTEADIKELIQHKTSPEFCPQNAIWITCRSTYYFPHSNECGPRTLLALHVMASHPHPHKDMLVPLMHPNIAQITRTWLTHSMITGIIHDTPVNSIQSGTQIIYSSTSQSIPSDIIQWDVPTDVNQQIIPPSPNMLDYIPSTHNLYNSDDSNKTPETPISIKESKRNHIKNDTSHPYDKNTSYSIRDMADIGTTPKSTNVQQTQTAPKVIQTTLDKWTFNRHLHLNDNNDATKCIPITRFGTEFPSPDPTKTLRIIMQNTQYSMQLSQEDEATIQTISNLKALGASIFTAISPNINWCNSSNTVNFKKKFQRTYQQVHLSAASSDMGKDPNYFQQRHLTGGVAILTFDHWASKITETITDSRGHGTYTITTIRGRNGKYLSLIGAYISVNKGQNIGPNTVWAQQLTLMERDALKKNKILPASTCPRKEAIKAIGNIIENLQRKNHAIILMVDANQTVKESTQKNIIKLHSIEWLRVKYGLVDPFLELMGCRPNTTTSTPGRDIDYILTHGVDIRHITTLGMHMPAISDHQGIGIDIDISTFFSGTYSTLANTPNRLLTVNNIKVKQAYLKYIPKETETHKLWEKAFDLYEIARTKPFTDEDEKRMNNIDDKVTAILLAGAKQSANRRINRDNWSPKLCNAGRNLVYWKRKHKMAKKKHFKWHELDSLKMNTHIQDKDHHNIDIQFIKQSLCQARILWKAIKKESGNIRMAFLEERAEEHAAKLHTTKEIALKAILQAEESKRTYNNIRQIAGHRNEKTPLTQIDIDNPNQPNTPITITTKLEMENAIIQRNQRHARQALQTPFAAIPHLATAIDPIHPDNTIDQILDGTIRSHENIWNTLTPTEQAWMDELQRKIMTPIDTYVSLQDFIKFFKLRKERTASSPSGRHMGHYKIIADRAEYECNEIAQSYDPSY